MTRPPARGRQPRRVRPVGARLLRFADVVRYTAPEHQARLVSHIVERVVVEGWEVVELRVRLETRRSSPK